MKPIRKAEMMAQRKITEELELLLLEDLLKGIG